MTPDITTVESRRDLGAFLGVPWAIYPGRYPQWVPPLRSMVRETLDPDHDPFWKNADRALFLAHVDGRVVGRIAAIENRRHNQIHQDRVGFFGFFECVDDQEVADALFGAARQWLIERGLDQMRGPASPSMNHECGLLVDGFIHAPTVLTPWNPPYYETLVLRAGFEPERDLLAYLYDHARGHLNGERVERLVARRSPASGITVRDLSLKRLDREIDLLFPLFNAAWKNNWGFVPMTEEEFRFSATSLKPLFMKNFVMVAEKDGRAVGFFMIAADLNQVLRKIPSGRLGPIALARLLFGLPRVRHGRVMLLGLDPDHRQGLLFPIFLNELLKRGLKYSVSAEASWVLEENMAIRNSLESLGPELYRRWRIYAKPIS